MATAVADVPNLTEFQDTSGMAVSDDLEAELIGGENVRKAKRFLYCYWRRPDGFITIAPNYGDERDFQIERGMESLRQYGTFQLHTRQWDAVVEPWRQIFARKGAKEFSVEQIIEHRWHRRPPYQGIVFPQLDGVELPNDYECRVCKRAFNSDTDLAKHEAVMHSSVSHDEALGRNLANAITLAQDGNNNQLADALTTLVSQFAAQNEQMAKMMEMVVAANAQPRERRGRPETA